LLEVLVHYANTGEETLNFSLFTDSSIDNVLLQTNPGCTSRFLNIPKLYLVDTSLHDSQTL